MKYITRTVWVLSLVSLFTDTASEMLYPVMPIYLKTIGFSVVLIGILEGIAEATAGLSKGYFGKLSDNTGKRVPFVQVGYALSAISKPMMAVFIYPIWIFFARTADRFGKGIRTGARDAIRRSSGHRPDADRDRYASNPTGRDGHRRTRQQPSNGRNARFRHGTDESFVSDSYSSLP